MTINIDGGDVGLVMPTDQETAPADSSINVTGKPKIRTGLRGTQGASYSADFPVANVNACETTIPFIKKMSQVNLTDDSNVTVRDFSYNAGLAIEEGSFLTTDENRFTFGAMLLSTAPGSRSTTGPQTTTTFLSKVRPALVKMAAGSTTAPVT